MIQIVHPVRFVKKKRMYKKNQLDHLPITCFYKLDSLHEFEHEPLILDNLFYIFTEYQSKWILISYVVLNHMQKMNDFNCYCKLTMRPEKIKFGGIRLDSIV